MEATLCSWSSIVIVEDSGVRTDEAEDSDPGEASSHNEAVEFSDSSQLKLCSEGSDHRLKPSKSFGDSNTDESSETEESAEFKLFLTV